MAGMFILNEETQCYWMNHTSTDTREFQLIGILLGLAIYNGVILDIHFPFVMYKKLMGVPLAFADIKEVEPVRITFLCLFPILLASVVLIVILACRHSIVTSNGC